MTYQKAAQCYKLGAINNINVGSASSAAQSAAFGTETWLIRIASPTGCFIAIDTNPTATTTSAYLPANVIETLIVSPGQKLSVFSTATQLVSVTECV